MLKRAVLGVGSRRFKEPFQPGLKARPRAAALLITQSHIRNDRAQSCDVGPARAALQVKLAKDEHLKLRKTLSRNIVVRVIPAGGQPGGPVTALHAPRKLRAARVDAFESQVNIGIQHRHAAVDGAYRLPVRHSRRRRTGYEEKKNCCCQVRSHGVHSRSRRPQPHDAP